MGHCRRLNVVCKPWNHILRAPSGRKELGWSTRDDKYHKGQMKGYSQDERMKVLSVSGCSAHSRRRGNLQNFGFHLGSAFLPTTEEACFGHEIRFNY